MYVSTRGAKVAMMVGHVYLYKAVEMYTYGGVG